MAEVQKSSPMNGEMAQRFVQFVMVQAQNILFVLGKIPSPDGMAMAPNLQAAKMLLDQLEMIKIKTSGNLSAQEAKILDDALSNIQLAFVEASGGTPASMMPSRTPQYEMPEFEEENAEDDFQEPERYSPPVVQKQAQPPVSKPEKEEPEPDAEDDKKKFFKSYG